MLYDLRSTIYPLLSNQLMQPFSFIFDAFHLNLRLLQGMIKINTEQHIQHKPA